LIRDRLRLSNSGYPYKTATESPLRPGEAASPGDEIYEELINADRAEI
jgi:hypothetical protein